jgi:hypothetical protein
MKTEELREKLHNYIETAHERKLKAIYTMVEEEIDETDNLWKNEAFIDELERRKEGYLSRTKKTFSFKETMAGVNEAIKKAKMK